MFTFTFIVTLISLSDSQSRMLVCESVTLSIQYGGCFKILTYTSTQLVS